MERSSLRNGLFASLAAHLLLTTGAVTWVRTHPSSLNLRSVETVEVDFVQQEPQQTQTPPAPTPPPSEPPPAPSAPASERPAAAQPQANARTITPSTRILTSTSTTQTTPPEVGAQPEPPPNAVPPTNAPPPSQQPSAVNPNNLQVAALFTGGGSFGELSAAARSGGVDLGRPGSARANRDLFGRPRPTGTMEENARAAAMAPITTALAETQHTRAAGSGELSRTVNTRLSEDFSPVAVVPNIGNAVARAPVVSLPTVSRGSESGAGGREAAASAELNATHGLGLATMTGPSVTPCNYRMLRVDVEVDQTASGEISATRVLRRSGFARFDSAVETAVRDAIPPTPPRAGTPLRSQWSFELSEAIRVPTPFCDNSGWRMITEESNGVQLRYRVRMLSCRSIPQSNGSGGTTTPQPG